jgi:hypothetical protein
MNESEEDEQVGTPAMDRADEPTKLHACHDKAHAVEGLGDGGAIVQEQQESGEHLNAEEEERDAAEVVPGSSGMQGDNLVVQQIARHAQAESFVEPFEGFGFQFRG